MKIDSKASLNFITTFPHAVRYLGRKALMTAKCGDIVTRCLIRKMADILLNLGS